MILNVCNEKNKIVTQGLASSETARIVIINAVQLKEDGTFVRGYAPLYIYDTLYTGEYEWRGIDEDTAKAKVAELNAGTGTVGGDGSSGLKLTIDEQIVDSTKDNVATNITTRKKQIMMGTATAQHEEGEFWSVRVSINYTITSLSIGAKQ